jgi:CRP/FNR family transcriptional regulator
MHDAMLRCEMTDKMTSLSYGNLLTYLPRRPIQEYAKSRIIYDVERPATDLYLVILGRVKVGTTASDGGQAVVRIVRKLGVFGESSLIGLWNGSESAMALDTVTLMSWSRNEIEQQVEREPRLGIALAQYLVRQCLNLQDRIESMAVRKTPERVMLALLQLAADLGVPLPDGSLHVAALTHHTIAEFVGTSREIVTFQMNRLRRMGMVRYSRKHIDIYVQALRENLRQGISVPNGAKDARTNTGRLDVAHVLDVKSAT